MDTDLSVSMLFPNCHHDWASEAAFERVRGQMLANEVHCRDYHSEIRCSSGKEKSCILGYKKCIMKLLGNLPV
jgi:hypothetical protein